MERTSLPGLASPHARPRAAGSLQRLRQGLEPLALNRLAALWQELLVASIAVFAAWQFATLAFERHDSFQSNAYDLGFFDQIIWNTSQGRFFETSFVEYNFLGQHFDPVLLVFAGLYALGGGIKTLLFVQAASVALAAVPLFLATRRLTGSAIAAFACSGAFLLSPQLHAALNFDFHPETLSFVFVFSSLYFLSREQPKQSALAAMPLLLLKEDLAMVVLAMAALLVLQGYRREGIRLGAVAVVWAVAAVLVAMPLLRGGGSSDLTRRYSYLVEGSDVVQLVPVALVRGGSHLWQNTVPAGADLLLSGGLVGLLSPAVLLLALPNLLISGLADHAEQSSLGLHYSVPVLALMWVSVALGLEKVASFARRGEGRRFLTAGVSIALLGSASLSFYSLSPYAPNREDHRLDPQHQAAMERALALIPRDASVEAQSSILPHLSQRKDVFEFPDKRVGEYVIVDAWLPVNGQSRDAGFDARLAALPDDSYQLIYHEGPVQVFRRSQ